MTYEIALRTPGACSANELRTFIQMVQNGGEVEGRGLRARVGRAKKLDLVYDGEAIIGVGAIKNPNKEYHHGVFKKALTCLPWNDYPVEIGWLYIERSHRGRGLGGCIVDKLMTACLGEKLFSTSRADNDAVRHLLKSKGFIETGVHYMSRRDSKVELTLYVTK